MRSVLYIAYHYPPVQVSSGALRTLAFTRHLSKSDWDVRVLTVARKAYKRCNDEQSALIPDQVRIIRAFARDVSRHFSWRGKYWSAMALPDLWQSWILGGVASGIGTILRHRPDAIVSTYPIASAHFIGYALHRLTGIPWIADLRDPMAQPDYPTDATQKRWFEWIERRIVKYASHVTVVTPGAKQMYEQRFPHVRDGFWQLIPNGFDEAVFADLSTDCGTRDDRLVLLHSGVIYPSERDPTQLFAALAELKKDNTLRAEEIEIRLRASEHDAILQPMVDPLDIADIVRFAPSIPYKEALNEIVCADGLLLLQAQNCDAQIPAKAYEYLRARRPILALTTADGDTGRLLADSGAAEIAPLDDKQRIKQGIRQFLARLRDDDFRYADDTALAQHSRQHQAKRFESLILDAIRNKNTAG